MELDHDRCYRAIQSRDARFDGCFVVAVRTTHIYCRPSCSAATPKQKNVEFHLTAAAAQQRGFRACKMCRPDATPGSPEWANRADVTGRAMRLIADGVVDRSGVSGLAASLGYSERQLHRLLTAEVGAGPLALARAQRAHTARLLLETTAMRVTDVAFAAGFASVRQFNDTIREVYADTPSGLRNSRQPATPGEATLTVRLAVRQPFQAGHVIAFLAARAVPSVEEAVEGAYRRSLRLAHGNAVVELRPVDGAVMCSLWLDDVADTQTAVQRCRRMLDLDADPQIVDAALAASATFRHLVAAAPGLRSPGHPDGAELLTRAILGQQITVQAARTLTTRLVAEHGEPLRRPLGGITHVFPSPTTLAAVSPVGWRMPRARAETVIRANELLADGSVVIDAGSDRNETERRLCAVRGVGPWTAGYVRMRALGDPDVMLPSDTGVRNALVSLGESGERAHIDHAARAWSPWRSYALHHLWHSLDASTTRHSTNETY